MTTLANLNGKVMPLSEVMVPALDRGFLFGDAIYEVLRVYQGKAFLLDEHWRRLERSLEAVRITGVDLKRLRQRLLETIAAAGFPEAMAYLQITRGAAAARSHAFPEAATPLELISVQEYVDTYSPYRRQGAAVITLPDLRWERCDVKSTNLLANVLATQSAKEAGALEALLYLADGHLTEGSHSSFFAVLDGQLRTTPNGHAILPGVTRQFVVGLAERIGISLYEHMLKREGLTRVTELFLTGTTSEVLPVVMADGKPIGEGKPGPVTRRLQAAYVVEVEKFVASGVA